LVEALQDVGAGLAYRRAVGLWRGLPRSDQPLLPRDLLLRAGRRADGWPRLWGDIAKRRGRGPPLRHVRRVPQDLPRFARTVADLGEAGSAITPRRELGEEPTGGLVQLLGAKRAAQMRPARLPRPVLGRGAKSCVRVACLVRMYASVIWGRIAASACDSAAILAWCAWV
jgi:hypothetical protein